MNSHADVMVFCEVGEGGLTPIAAEIIGAGRRLADDLGEQLMAVILGSDIAACGEAAIALGVDKAYVADHNILADYQNDTYVKVMTTVLEATRPKILLLGQTIVGRDLAPALAFALDTAAVMDCVDLSLDADSGRLHLTKPIYGGNVMAVNTISTDPQIATVRAKSVEPATADPARQGDTAAVDVQIDAGDVRIKLVRKIKEQVEGLRLEDAKVVVGGGRGIGGEEDFAELEKLARMLGGTVGATRAVCDNGWLPVSKQIGLTGKVISPELYIAIAISGASQHMAGCYGADTIVAINKDDEANIFKEAKYGVEGDWREVLPGFINRLKELKG